MIKNPASSIALAFCVLILCTSMTTRTSATILNFAGTGGGDRLLPAGVGQADGQFDNTYGSNAVGDSTGIIGGNTPNVTIDWGLDPPLPDTGNKDHWIMFECCGGDRNAVFWTPNSSGVVDQITDPFTLTGVGESVRPIRMDFKGGTNADAGTLTVRADTGGGFSDILTAQALNAMEDYSLDLTSLGDVSSVAFVFYWDGLGSGDGSNSFEIGELEFQQGGIVAQPTSFEWNLDGTGDWNNSDPVHWSPRTIPDSPNHTAVFGSKITQARTVATEQTVTVNSIEFNNAFPYAIAGNGAVNLAAKTSASPGPSNLSVAQGSHQFQVVVNLDNATTANIASGSTLTFNNALNLNGHTLTKSGVGMLTVNNLLNSGGGTLAIVEGTVSGNGTVGGGLDNQSGTVAPGGYGGGDAPGQVPEPASWVLVVMGIFAGVGLMGRRWHR